MNGDLLLGILGIPCGLVAFIGGWMKADEMDHGGVMTVWSFCFLIGIVLRFAMASMGMGS